MAEDRGVSRRAALGAAAGGLLFLAASPGSARAAATGTAVAPGVAALAAGGAGRTSLITQGTTLVHADMHNHTTMSDGDGDPTLAFASMRSAGLDVAALTDHSGVFGIGGLSSAEWKRTATLADAANVVDVIETTAGQVTRFTVPLNTADGDWVVLRVSDPSQANASPGPAGHACNDWGVAYSSPWWLQG
ncbi:PHP domain-containing protein [Actinocorallia herbida]|uniref:PHP domain-containing protein n=1 Tax=Actinocorallia herbida TaxID=58109 RepID=UPI000F4CA86C|nr:hypothetical protein [Actinocorallia herbida]